MENGYSVKPLSNGDCIVVIRRDGCRNIEVKGDDPQERVSAAKLKYEGNWSIENSPDAWSGPLHVTDSAGANAGFEFTGNQVRLIGLIGPGGGRADVYLDGVKQLCGIDFWCPLIRGGQIVFYKNGLTQGKHTLKIVALGTNNPCATGTRIYIQGMQWSAAEGTTSFGEGDGATESQRVIFGYVGRKNYVDSERRTWRPATEFVMRLKQDADLVPISFWTEPRLKEVGNTRDPELYRYGVHGGDFTAYFTVNPQAKYYARIKLCEPEAPVKPGQFSTNIDVQGQTVAKGVDIAATAGGYGKAVDLVFNDIRPKNGVIAIRFWHGSSGQASCQAIEIGEGKTDAGAKPILFRFPTAVR